LEKYEELRRLIARCCEISEAADKVAIQALRAVERQGKRTAAQARDLRARMSVLERQWRSLVRHGRVR
jgi:hypothetical protein